jgi:hypothetical protein
MSFKIEIQEKVKTPEEMVEVLRRIADLIDDGYIEGNGPNWTLKEN